MTSKARKTKVTPRKRARKKAASKKPGLLRRLFKLSMLLTGLGIGLGVPWVVWLDMQVRDEFEGRMWDLPSRVYARPLSLYTGKALSRDALLVELNAAGYRQVPRVTAPGSYDVNGARFEI